MSEVMYNIKEKFSDCRELCPNMPEALYVLTDHLSHIANDDLTPMGMTSLLALVLDDIREGQNHFLIMRTEQLPDALIVQKKEVLEQAKYLPQVIDVIAGNEEFAREFRIICKLAFGYNPPKYNPHELSRSGKVELCFLNN